MKQRKGSAPPRVALRRWHGGGWQYYVAARGTGNERVEARWDPDFNAGTHFASRYAAKQARGLVGMEAGDCHPHAQ